MRGKDTADVQEHMLREYGQRPLLATSYLRSKGIALQNSESSAALVYCITESRRDAFHHHTALREMFLHSNVDLGGNFVRCTRTLFLWLRLA